MNCNHFEELLPAYAEGDLDADKKAVVEAHLDGCGSCRDSLAFFVALEGSLAMRRQLRPSARVASRRIARRVGFGSYRFRMPALFGMQSLPAVLSGALIAVGIALFLARGAVAEFFTRLDTIRFKGDFGSEIAQLASSGLNSVAVGSELTWAAAYLGVFALILLSGSWMVLRYVRD